MRKNRANLLRVLISVGALLFLFWRVTSPGETLEVLGRADPLYLLGAFLLFAGSLVIRAYRWLILLRALDPNVPFARLVYLYFAGQFFSSFLPTQFGGDVMRALELTEDTDSAAAIGTVLVDRMSGLLVLLMMGLAGLPFVAASVEPWLTWLLVAVSGAGLLAGALVLEGRFLRRLTARLPNTISLVGEGPLARIYAAATDCGRGAVAGAFAVSVGFNVVNILINWFSAQAVGIEANPGYFFIVTPLLSVSGLIPSIAGWGVREAVSAALFTPVGVEESAAVALGITLNGISLLAGLAGGIVYGFERLRSSRESRRNSDAQSQ